MEPEVPYQILEFEEATEKKIKKAFLDGLEVRDNTQKHRPVFITLTLQYKNRSDKN